MEFDWDRSRAAANRRKYGVSFDEAEDVFTAPAIFEDFGTPSASRAIWPLGSRLGAGC